MDDKEIKQMHQRKMQRWDRAGLGMQIGACVNKAVDIAIHNGVIGKHIVQKKEIEDWVDILFEIGSNKKAELTEVQPIDMEKAQKQGKDWQKKQEELVNEGRQREAQDKLIQP